MTTDTVATHLFSHVKASQAEWKGGGLRDFFLY